MTLAIQSQPGMHAPAGQRAARTARLAAGLIALATLAVYGNSFKGVFVFDDLSGIMENASLRQLWPPGRPLSPPAGGDTVSGRPLLNLSLALNYAASGYAVWSYHAVNLAIHLGSALLLFGILRRTFRLPALPPAWAAGATPRAAAVALLWAVHPLQTESVTYVIQRAESLMGLLYLLTLYCMLRGASSARGTRWYLGAVLACLLGMASKEVMVSAPLIVLLYDRTFLAGSFRAAWRRRARWYVALAGTWLLLAWLVVASGHRGDTAGFQAGIRWWAYLGTQCGAIAHYLRLCVWPHPLVLDYGLGTARGIGAIAPYALLVGLLGLATAVALRRWPQVGFLGAWFFALLAPSSSVIPVTTELMAEHRMYLPLAAVLTGLVIAVYAAGQKLRRQGIMSPGTLTWLGRLAVLLAAVVLGALTWRRNGDYRSEASLWQDTVRYGPRNERALVNLGAILADAGQYDAALVQYQKALAIKPGYPPPTTGGDLPGWPGVMTMARWPTSRAPSNAIRPLPRRMPTGAWPGRSVAMRRVPWPI